MTLTLSNSAHALTNFGASYYYSGELGPVPTILLLIAVVASVIGLWKVFQKAGKPGWVSIVPIYNLWVLFEITNIPAWLSLFVIIPFLSLVTSIAAIISYYRIAKMFGKSDGFAIANVFFPFVCLPILGFGDAVFQGHSTNTPAGFTPPVAGTPEMSSPTPPEQVPPVSTPPTDTPTPPTTTPPTNPVG